MATITSSADLSGKNKGNKKYKYYGITKILIDKYKPIRFNDTLLNINKTMIKKELLK
tara:strand:- start:2057 stop:2227 length:171 start_codon:yes stop_codon:yes gene_type:complete